MPLKLINNQIQEIPDCETCGLKKEGRWFVAGKWICGGCIVALKERNDEMTIQEIKKAIGAR